MKIQLKRSNVLENGVAKEPTAAQMEYGELAVNYNENDISIFTKDSDNNIRRVGGSVNKGSGEPGDPGTTPGDWYFDITNNILYYWDGSGWEEVQAVSKLIASDGIEITTATTGTTFAVDLAGGDDGLEFDGGKLKATIASSSEYGVVKIGNGLDGGDDGIIKARNTITVGEDPPVTNLNQGDLWWNSGEDSGRLYVYYEDENTQQWIDASPQGGNLEQDQADQLYLSKKNDDTAVGNITFTKKIFVDEAVGIGTSSPSEKLTVIADQQRQGLSVLRSSGGAQGVILSSHTTGNEITNSYPDGNQKPLRIVNYNKDLNTQSTVATFSNTGRVGIGVDSPNVTLQVSGPSSTLAIDDTTTQIPMLRFRDNGTTIGRIYMTNEDMRFDTGGTTERIRITKAGRVGINSTAPSAILEISGFGGSTNNGVPSLYLRRAPSVGSTSDIAISGNAAIRAENSIRSVVNDSGFFSWSVGGADVTAGTDGSSEIMRISPTGKVGIGTTSPSQPLHVVGEEIFVGNNGRAEYHLYNSGGITEWLIGQRSNTSHGLTVSKKVGTNVIQIVEVASDGNVGIGESSPSGKLDVKTGNNERVVLDSAGSTSPRISLIRDTGSDYNFVNDLGVYRFYRNETIELYRYASDTHVWNTENSGEVVRFTSDGKVGVGIIPLAKLHVREEDSYSNITAGSATILLNSQSGTYTPGEYVNNIVWSRPSSNGGTATAFIGLRNVDAAGAAGTLAFGASTSSTVEERMAIDPQGRVLVGQFTKSGAVDTVRDIGTTVNRTASLQLSGSNAGSAGISQVTWKDDSTNPHYTPHHWLARSNSASIGTPRAVVDGMPLGVHAFAGDDGTTFINAAAISAYVDGTPGTNDMPGRLVFSTTADGASTPTERMRIRSDGNVAIADSGTDYQLVSRNGNSGNGNGGAVEVFSNRVRVNESVTNYMAGYMSRPIFDFDGTITTYHHFRADPNNLTNGSITNHMGFAVTSVLNTGTNNYGFYSDIASGSGRWNFYATGTASNYFAGTVFFGVNTATPLNNGSANAKRIDDNTFVMQSSRDSTDELNHFGFYNPNGYVGSISTNGNATAFNTSSDYRLKENIAPLTGAADRVKALKPCRFNFKADTDKTVDGFIAHEAQTVVPEAVTGTKDATEAIGVLFDWDDTVIERGVTEPEELTYTEEVTTPAVEAQEATYDEDGNELTPAVEASEEVTTTVVRTRRWEKFGDRAVMQGIDQSKLVPLLTAALQEALERIEQLESKVSAL